MQSELIKGTPPQSHIRVEEMPRDEASLSHAHPIWLASSGGGEIGGWPVSRVGELHILIQTALYCQKSQVTDDQPCRL